MLHLHNVYPYSNAHPNPTNLKSSVSNCKKTTYEAHDLARVRKIIFATFTRLNEDTLCICAGVD